MAERATRPNPWTQSWSRRVAEIAAMLRETSTYGDDPQESVLAFSRRMRAITPVDPWREPHRLPVMEGGFLGEVLYAGEPRFVPDLRVTPDDPAAAYLEGMRAAFAVPSWDNGEALNMVVQLAADPNALDPERLPEVLWTANLFGRATKNLVLSRQVKEAYAALDHELKTVADMQMSLLPRDTPSIRTLELATHYQTSHRAGGDYYDFFDLDADRWGILVGDVSGHGTPAAVLMAIVHAIAHLMPGEPWPPHRVLAHVNRELARRYTREGGAFVTMLYAAYDADARVFHYANAGHPDPIVRRRGGSIERPRHPGAGLPLGIVDDAEYAPHALALAPGDAIVLYTDGITEAFDDRRELFGEARLERAIARGGSTAAEILGAIIEAVGAHAGLASRSDDRTLVVGVAH